MIGSETGPGRVPCRRIAEDSDPLLAFTNEPGVGSSGHLSLRSCSPTRCCGRRCAAAAPAPAVDPLIARVDRLERALDGFEEAGRDAEVRSGDISPRARATSRSR